MSIDIGLYRKYLCREKKNHRKVTATMAAGGRRQLPIILQVHHDIELLAEHHDFS